MLKKNWTVNAGLFVICALIGLAVGRMTGTHLLEGVVLRESRLPLLVLRPVGQYYDIYRLLNSTNPFSRLSGYYALVENGMIDVNFLIERYRVERFPVIKKALLWALGFSQDRRRVVDFYRSIYGESDGEIQSEIRTLMKRVCRGGNEGCALPGTPQPGTAHD